MTSELEKKDKGENGLFWNGFSFFHCISFSFALLCCAFPIETKWKSPEDKAGKRKKEKKNQYEQYVATIEKPCLTQMKGFAAWILIKIF